VARIGGADPHGGGATPAGGRGLAGNPGAGGHDAGSAGCWPWTSRCATGPPSRSTPAQALVLSHGQPLGAQPVAAAIPIESLRDGADCGLAAGSMSPGALSAAVFPREPERQLRVPDRGRSAGVRHHRHASMACIGATCGWWPPSSRGPAPPGWPACVVTFEPHPRCVLDPRPLSAEPDDPGREDLVAQPARPGPPAVIPLRRQVAAQSPADFMRRLSRGCNSSTSGLAMTSPSAGAAGGGITRSLRQLATRQGFALDVVPAQERAAARSAARAIRRLLLLGQVRGGLATPRSRLLLALGGGAGGLSGAKAGVPHGHLKINAQQAAARPTGVRRAGSTWRGASIRRLNPGVSSTFRRHALTVEVFLFDYEGDLYGKLLTVFFVQRLRGSGGSPPSPR